MEQKIEGDDVYGDPWRAATLRPDEAYGGACVWLEAVDRGDAAASTMDKSSASRLGAFLLSAAAVKVVDAAREVVAAQTLSWSGETLEARNEAARVRELAIGMLASELAKLDALTGDK